MEEKQEQLKYIIYRRKSSEAEDKQTLSLDSQKRELTKFANQNNLKIVADFEESQSAYKKGRSKFAEMIYIIEQGKANAILIYHISRLSRNMTDGGLIIDMLKDDILKEVKTPTEVYTKESSQSFFLTLQFAMSKKSSDDTSQFVKRDIQAKLIKGEVPNLAPRGYLNIDPNGRISGKAFSLDKQVELGKLKRPLKRVEKDPFLSTLISKLFEECSTGHYTLDNLRDVAFKWGLTGGRSQKKMCKASLYRILTNPFYYGGIRWTGKIIEPHDLPVGTKHEPIISKELFERVQEVLGLRSLPISKKRFYTYSNLMRCSVCGGNISGITAKGIPYYRCCKCKGLSYVRESDLEEQISKRLDELTIDDDFYKLAMEEANIENEKEISQRENIKKQQQMELSRCQQRLDNLLRLKIAPNNKNNELLSDEEFINQKRETSEEMRAIKEKMEDTESRSLRWFDLCTQYVDFMKNLNEKFKYGSQEQRRDIFQFIYYNPVITEKVLINSDVSPHRFIFEYNNYKQSTITAENSMNTNKKDAFASLCLLGREKVDEVITFFKEYKGYYYIPKLPN